MFVSNRSTRVCEEADLQSIDRFDCDPLDRRRSAHWISEEVECNPIDQIAEEASLQSISDRLID